MRNRYTDPCSRLWIKDPRVKVIDRYGDPILVRLDEVSTGDREVSFPELPVQPSARVERSVQQIMEALEDLSQVLPVSPCGHPEEYL